MFNHHFFHSFRLKAGLAILLIAWLVLPVASTRAALDGADSGLVAYYTFDEGSGTTADDSSGSGNNGTLVNGPTWNTADKKVGIGALSFDGVNDYVYML